jgi:hypothetical protein
MASQQVGEYAEEAFVFAKHDSYDDCDDGNHDDGDVCMCVCVCVRARMASNHMYDTHAQMYLCVYVCVRTNVFMYVWVRAHKCIYVCMCACAQMYLCMYVCVRTNVFMCVCVRAHKCIYVCMGACVRAQVYYAFYAFYAWWIHFPQSGTYATKTCVLMQPKHAFASSRMYATVVRITYAYINHARDILRHTYAQVCSAEPSFLRSVHGAPKERTHRTFARSEHIA